LAERFDIWAPKFRNALGQFVKVRDSVLLKAAKHGEKKARGYAPVDTGELRANIEGRTEGVGTGRRVSRARVFLSAPRKYAPIEFGSRRGHRAQRFLERGLSDALDFAAERIADDIEDLLIKGKAGHIGPRFSGRDL